jgi:hypothetical protein
MQDQIGLNDLSVGMDVDREEGRDVYRTLNEEQ